MTAPHGHAAAVLLAAGSGSRLAAGMPKALVPLGGVPLVRHGAALFASISDVARIVLVVPAGDDGAAVAAASGLPGATVVTGGARRRDSVYAGVTAAEGAAHVLVHDCARPFAGEALVRRVLEAARRHRAAIPALPVADMLVRDEAGHAGDEVPRAGLRAVQTPQGFERELLLEAHRAAPADWDAADDGAMVRRLGVEVTLVDGNPDNVKITYPSDLQRGAASATPRTGFGWDVHPLEAGRPFRLAGIEVDPATGPRGHSDGDPLSHAVADALLGAAALGDIGTLFPDTDPACAGISGPSILTGVVEALAAAGWRPLSLDAVLVVDRPKIAPHRDAIRAALAATLGLPVDAVSLKGKRTEGLGGLADGKGVACHAVATVGRR